MFTFRSLYTWIILIIMVASGHKCFAQTCTVIASTTNICAGSSVSFSVNITGGGTPVSYSWSFGDGFTGSTALPGHTYLTAGNYTPSVTVNFSGGGSCNATGPVVKVFALPVSKYVITTADTMCFKYNRLCILDQSTSGPSNAPIKRRLFQVSNGYVQTDNAPYSNTLCYENNINLSGHLYTLVLEVTDTNNCTSRTEKTDSVLLYPKMQPVSFSSSYNPTCYTTRVNFSNTSLLPVSMVKKFYWFLGDGTIDSTSWSGPTHTYTATGLFVPKLYTIDINNCRDTATATGVIQNIIPDSTIYIAPLKNQCYKKNQFKFISNNTAGTAFWTIYDNNNNIAFSGSSSAPTDTFKVQFTTCGQYRVNMRVQFPDCSTETDTVIMVYGPRAVIQNDVDFVLNRTQCEIFDTVYFKTPVPYLSCRFSNGNMDHLWNFDDPFAPACTTDTKNGINVGMNCNFSKDSIRVKHAYTPGKERCYYPVLYMKDPILGCEDSDTISLGLTAPSARPDLTAVPPRRGLFVLSPAKPCLNQPITFSLKETLPICGFENAWVNVDSACGKNNWLPVTDIKGQTFTHTYLSTCDTENGYITVGLIIKNGKDKNGNNCYDTAWYHYLLKMTPINPAFTFKLTPGCGPFQIKIVPSDSTQYNLKQVKWGYSITKWEDIVSYMAGLRQTINNTPVITQNLALTDSVIFSQQFSDTFKGVYTVSATFESQEGCSRESSASVGVGSFREFYRPQNAYCLNDSVTLQDFVRYYDAGTPDHLSTVPHWRDPSRAAANKEKLWWNMGDGRGFVLTGPTPKVKYNQPGKYTITMVSQDSLGCLDTLVKPDYIVIVQPKALISSLQAAYYCAPQIVLFKDSSIVMDSPGSSVTSPLEAITSWTWDFADGKPGSILKNPAHNYTINGIFKVKLFIQTANGCKDSTSTDVNMKGPQPSFRILDTMGCEPFKTTFVNTTGRQLQSWTWYFGDPANQTFTTMSDTNMSFTYLKAGVYKVGLLGSENILNPGTGNTFNCLSFFPDTINQIPVRKIYVLATPPLHIKSKDSICPNEPIIFTASGDTVYSKFTWRFGDGASDSIARPDSTINHTYQHSGSYTVTLIPVNSTGYQCVDTATKTITASVVKADFEINDNEAPRYTFTNTSQAAVRYVWDFGKPAAGGANQSVETNPVFNYGSDTGVFTICLKAFNAEDCWDSICKQTRPDARLVIPNVFTPDNNDNKNDAFDIDIVGFTTYDLKIYNRWGAEVFKGDRDGVGNDGINWNGKNHNDGPLCPAGVYYFIFNYRLITDAADKTAHGTITLIRDK